MIIRDIFLNKYKFSSVRLGLNTSSIGYRNYPLIIYAFFILSSCIKGTNRDVTQPVSLKKEETFYRNIYFEPKTFHPIKNTDYASSLVQKHIFESLLQRNPDTYQWESSLAEKWEQSPDGKTFIFRLYKGLKWSDGKPLTAQDVKFSLEAYKDPVDWPPFLATLIALI